VYNNYFDFKNFVYMSVLPIVNRQLRMAERQKHIILSRHKTPGQFHHKLAMVVVKKCWILGLNSSLQNRLL